MGDIDSDTGVNLVQLENRQSKIKKIKKLKIGSFFFYCWAIWQKKIILDFLRIFDQFLIL